MVYSVFKNICRLGREKKKDKVLKKEKKERRKGRKEEKKKKGREYLDTGAHTFNPST